MTTIFYILCTICTGIFLYHIIKLFILRLKIDNLSIIVITLWGLGSLVDSILKVLTSLQ